jgi:hypothetical protein
MIPYKPQRVPKVASLVLLLVSFAAPAWSQVEEVESPFPKGFAKEGGYVGFSALPNFTFDGVTFDGQTAYKEIDGEELAILPRLDSRRMFRGAVGVRGRTAALEFSYERTHHNGSFADFPVDTTFQAINIDGRFFFLTKGRVQPHALVGASIPWLDIKDGSYLEPDLGDARWRGYGLNTEAGVTVYPHPRLGVSLGYSYRVMWFDRMTGVSETLFYLRPRFRETSGSFVLTGLVAF